MVEDLTTKDHDVVQVNAKAFAVDRHLQQKQFSTPTAPSFHSIHMQMQMEVLYQQMKVLAEQRKGKKLKRCNAWNIEPNLENLTIIRKGNYGIKEVIVDVLNNKVQVIFYPTFLNVILSNTTSVPLEVQIDISFALSLKVLHPIYPAEQLPLQVRLLLKLSSESVFGVYIHPAAQIGEGILLDHATGVVITETAVIVHAFRSIFQIDLSHRTATTTTSISAQLAEKLLSSQLAIDILSALNRSAGLHNHMSFTYQIWVTWVDNQLIESNTEDRILHYLNKHKPATSTEYSCYPVDTTIWLTLFPTNMVLRLNIDQIEPATRDWICKVQIVEIGRPRESLDKKCTFQNLILEDERECQIKAVMYADEIQQYADKLKLLNTYLISTARVKVSPTSYGKPIHQFYWILDKETVIEQIKVSNEVENPLPPPTKLNITGFNHIPHLIVDSTAEIDILAIVLRCGPQKNAGRSHHRCREITLCDNQKKQFLFTLWEDFGEIKGHEISSKMATEADLPVILGRSIGISTYQGLSLQTRYNSTVRVNSNYPQAVALINWAKENKTMLLGYASDKTSTSSTVAPIIVSPAAQQLISIAEISSAPSRQSLPLNDVHEMLSNKVFEIQLRKSSWASSNTTHATLSVLSYILKQHTPQGTTDRTSKRVKPLEISEVEIIPTATAAGSSNPTPKFEPPTPTKKM
ncbi:hypothetical protein H5410_035274 [Solanum commersonii]|uniref:Replication protein A OB domain-containing protein n=1 Tax=Solanum commersonii TaxID=4109 RepID=A0A9J5Y277_SOLCO|nr:hypothetical protein H5410_035274 [Solanum commersonii]